MFTLKKGSVSDVNCTQQDYGWFIIRHIMCVRESGTVNSH